MSVRVRAPAKINLTLKVGPPRADGMHPLESAVAFASVCDVIEAREGEGLSLAIHGDFADGLSNGDDNLVLRAACALAEASDRPAHAYLTLEKNLPIASGIGGGSADAAATLTALSRLWALNWPPSRLAELGASLGADVPVFFSGAPAAYMTGLGERCTPMQAPPLDAVLVNPLRPLPTPDVYRTFDALKLGSTLSMAPAPAWRTQDEALAAMRALGNDLEAPARALAPEIGEMLALLRADANVRYAALSGSGATAFAILPGRAAAEAFAAALRVRQPNWWVAETTLGA